MTTIGDAVAFKAAEEKSTKKKGADFNAALAKVGGTRLQIHGGSGDKKNDQRNRPQSRGQTKETNIMSTPHTHEEKTTGNGNGSIAAAATQAFEQRLMTVMQQHDETVLKTAMGYTDKKLEQQEARTEKRVAEVQSFVIGEAARAVASVEQKIADAERRAEEREKVTVKSGGQLALKTTIVTGVVAAVAGISYGGYRLGKHYFGAAES